MKETSTQVRRIDSDGSTVSTSDRTNHGERNAEAGGEGQRMECRRIETLFMRDVVTRTPGTNGSSSTADGGERIIDSVYGDDYFLPARIIYEGRTGCADKPVRQWTVPSPN